MNIAEQKVALLKLIVDADEATTMKLADFAKSLNLPTEEYSQEILAELNRRREAYLTNPESGTPWKEAMANIRERLSK